MMASKRFATDSIKLRSLFPLLVPIDQSGLQYDGCITIFDRDYRIKIKLPRNRRLAEAQIEGDLEMAGLLHENMDLVQQRLAQSNDLHSFLLELVTILEERLKNKHVVAESSLKSPEFYSKMVTDFNSVGWERICKIDDDFNEVHVRVKDERSREHILALLMPAEYPTVAPKSVCDLPSNFNIFWEDVCMIDFLKGNGLSDIVCQFEKQLRFYQTLWNELDDIDAKTWVMEPEKPRKSDLTRRVALGEGASLIFTVDAINPRAPPVWQMMGNDRVISPLQVTLDKTFTNWNETLSVVDNWKTVLKMELPSPMNTNREDVQIDCGICYVFKLGDKIPDRRCEDLKCKREYHSECLYEWLQSLPSSRRTFNTIFGECPYCNKSISCQEPL
ncbi:hypothetical protein CHUAL_003757 [Chamberlinius hualienensis]